MRLSAKDIKDLNLMKHYRVIRKWACKNNNLTDSDLELLIYLDCIDLFSAINKSPSEEMGITIIVFSILMPLIFITWYSIYKYSRVLKTTLAG